MAQVRQFGMKGVGVVDYVWSVKRSEGGDEMFIKCPAVCCRRRCTLLQMLYSEYTLMDFYS